MDVHVARQPIFRKNQSVYAYELLFRDGIIGCFPDIAGEAATCRVLSDAFFEMGIDKVTGGRKAFINFTGPLLISEIPTLFPNSILTVEILEDVFPDKQVVAACRELADRGYEIALDDFLYREELEPLIAAAHVIKFDFRLSPIEKLVDDIARLSGRGLKLLAEKVETREEFDAAVRLGFDYFQGFFFSKPDMLKKRIVTPVKIALIEVIAEVNKEGFRFSRIEELIMKGLPLDGNMKKALVNRTGPLAAYLNIVESYRSADWPDVEAECGKIGSDHTGVGRIYLESILKADRLAEL